MPVHVPVLHEHEGRRLGPAEDDLEAGPAVPAAFPPGLLVPHERGIDAEPLRQEELAQLDRVILPIDRMIGEVERVMRHHLEQGEVLARLPDVVDVDEPDARLADREGIRRGARLPADHPRLERIHTRLDEEDVVPPPRDDWIALHPRMAILLEEGKEIFAHGAVREFLLERRVADEVVLLARRLAARLMLPERPECLATFRTRLPRETLLPEKLDFVCSLAAAPPLVAFVHWGSEYTSEASGRERAIADRFGQKAPTKIDGGRQQQKAHHLLDDLGPRAGARESPNFPATTMTSVARPLASCMER